MDAGAMAPCIPTEAATYNSLVDSDKLTTLGKKLRASLIKHWDQLGRITGLQQKGRPE
ncbi:hypothetical protein HPB52_024960 [Rhipicephalus sanguineus]|nr:hypothetical protein HPB52_024960 [Rhipicephalus sanguineus]